MSAAIAELPPQDEYRNRGQRLLESIGVDSYAQSDRAGRLIDVLGDQGIRIAQAEFETNQRAYVREFIEDEPVSEAHIYHLNQGEFYSDHVINPETSVRRGIHSGERGGMTLEGFTRFESLASQPENRVAVWYSPAGSAGSRPPFNRLRYDSGRLYLCFKGIDDLTYNFDIKIREESFPIKELLNYLSGEEVGDLYQRLVHPFATTEEAAIFFRRLENFNRHSSMAEGKTPVYEARRHDPDHKTYFWDEIVREVKKQLMEKISQPAYSTQPYHRVFYTQSIDTLTRADAIEKALYEQMDRRMLALGKDEIFLYGCSTTSTVRREYDGSLHAAISELQSMAAPSIYSSLFRVRPSDFLSASDVSTGLKDCARCGACNHVGLDVNNEGNWLCPKCHAVGPKAPMAA